MKVRGVFAPVVVSLVLSACSTTGVAVTDTQAQQFTVGSSTISDVEAKLGTPTGSSTNSDGTTIISYKQDKNHADPMAYVPIAGMFSYGSRTDTREVVFTFSRAGVLTSYHADNSTS